MVEIARVDMDERKLELKVVETIRSADRPTTTDDFSKSSQDSPKGRGKSKLKGKKDKGSKKPKRKKRK